MALPEIDFRLLSLLTPAQAHGLKLIPLVWKGETLLVLGDERGGGKIPECQLLIGKRVSLQKISASEVDQLLHTHYPFHESTNQSATTEVAGSDAVRFVNKCLEEAANMGASDIHCEVYESTARIRFRWEGQMIEKYDIPIANYHAVVSRIKILAELDIAERRLPQDGRIPWTSGENTFDIRVSTMPTKHGEKVVMRLLTRSEEHLNLSRLGINPKALEQYHEAISQPNGLILITGPTNSGKTTTLYATLKRLNVPDKNLLTVEDPIEYNLEGINQVQVKEDIGLSFDRTLRAFLRQDPDIIMVGEIRDADTAQTAIRAALTGHLVFSTLHTNSAIDAVTRLLDMGLEPYLLAASLRLLVAQRLVRVLCSQCKAPSRDPHPLLAPGTTHYLPTGCPSCYYTGYSGRRAVYEILPVSKAIQEWIKTQEGDPQELMEQSSVVTMSDNLMRLVEEGITSVREIVGVV